MKCVFLLYARTQAYASFGGTAVLSDIDSAKFAKMAKETGLCEGKLSLAAVDVAFSKAKSKGTRRLAFREFENAIGLLGACVCYRSFACTFVICRLPSALLPAITRGAFVDLTHDLLI